MAGRELDVATEVVLFRYLGLLELVVKTDS